MFDLLSDIQSHVGSGFLLRKFSSSSSLSLMIHLQLCREVSPLKNMKNINKQFALEVSLQQSCASITLEDILWQYIVLITTCLTLTLTKP